MTPLLSIVMAHYEDFDGVYFTIQAMRIANPELMSKIEIVVVTNSPGSAHSKMVQEFLGSIAHTMVNVKFVEMADPIGTSPSRNRAIAEATGQYVVCMDCHVLLIPGALKSLLAYYEKNPHCDDLIHGPLVYDQLTNCSTHFSDVWRGEMWGTWGTAWRCDCGSQQRLWFAEEHGKAVPKKLLMGSVPYPYCADCGMPITSVDWPGHEQNYLNSGLKPQKIDGSEPFPIPSQGLGLFSMRRASWLGFNEHARGFGGEEMYIDEKYRRSGRQGLCLPALGWVHRFGRPDGVKYPLSRWNKVRNYVLEFNELGMDVAPIHEHFVKTNLMPQAQWDKLISDPIKYEKEEQCKTCGGGPQLQFSTIDEAFDQLRVIPRDLNEHMPVLREYAAKVEHVTEFDSRREPTIAFLAAKPKTLISYNKESGAIVDAARQLVPDTAYRHEMPDYDNLPDIEQTGLIFIDSRHNAKQLTMELAAFAPKVSRFIALHDTDSFGRVGDDGSDGLLKAVHSFLFPDGKPGEWFVAYHTPNQYGLTVLGKLPEDRPPEPIPLVVPEQGPGTELKKILGSIGIHPTPECPCNLRAAQMDIFGVAGCVANKDKIVQWLKDGSETWGWNKLFSTAMTAVLTGLAFRISWTDPIPSIVQLAIDNAEKADA